jgi:short-subunit dehydrogenase
MKRVAHPRINPVRLTYIMNASTTAPLAVVTGASSGIGFELARQFAQNGFDLLIAADGPKINDAASLLNGNGSKVSAVQVDLSKPDGVEKLYEEIRATGRPLEAIAINAGVGISGEFARGTTLEDNMNVIDLNVRSSVHLAKRVLPDMVARGKGRVLFTSSIAATMPGPFDAVYNASKAFLQSFSQAIRNELEDTGVTVTALMPGATETNFFRRAGMENTKVGASEDKDDAAEVAKEGFEAMMAGKDHVVAGSMMNTVQATMAHVLPDTTTAAIHRKQAEPGSATRD